MNTLSRVSLFPNFQPITLDIRRHFDQYTQQYETYSDFNFISLWSYMGHNCLLSNLLGNLVFQMRDYVTLEPLVSVLGDTNLIHVLDTLFEYLDQSTFKKELRLVPASLALPHLMKHERYSFHMDRDNFDYIIDVRHLLKHEGKDMKHKQRDLHAFYSRTPRFEVREIDIRSPQDCKHILNLVEHWISKKDVKNVYDDTEAIRKLLTHEHDFHTVDVGIFIDNRLVAFSINELITADMYMAHFGKADKSVPGIYTMMEYETARIMHERYACKYFNFQQDLGIAKLRKSKLSYQPVKFLEKGTISRVHSSHSN